MKPKVRHLTKCASQAPQALSSPHQRSKLTTLRYDTLTENLSGGLGEDYSSTNTSVLSMNHHCSTRETPKTLQAKTLGYNPPKRRTVLVPRGVQSLLLE